MSNILQLTTIRRACGLALAGLATAAAAATPAIEAALEEVTVSAARREQSLQDVPMAVTVFGADEIRTRGLAGIGSIGQRVPGLAISQPTRNSTNFSLRGAGSLVRNPGLDQPTALFVDEVYVGQGSAIEFDLFDIERVEVLRGPQGTLYGKNVVGGAVNVITRQPTAEPRALFEVTAGRFGRLDANGVVSGGLGSDELSGQLAFSHRSSDGYTTNLITGNNAEQEDTSSVRGKLRYQPSDRVDITATIQYARDKSTGIERVLRGDTLDFVGELPNDHTAVTNEDGRYDRELLALSLYGVFETDWGKLTSVTGYRNNDNRFFDGDNDGTPLTLVHFLYQLDDARQWSQELRLSGSSERFDWVAGLYYLNIEFAQNDAVQIAGAPGSLAAIVLTNRLGVNGAIERFGQDITTDSYAVFGQLDYRLAPELKLSVGGRYTYEEKSGNTYCASIGQQCLAIYNVAVSKNWSAFTPRVGLEYKPVDSALLYATASKGFKSGGFMTGYPTPVGVDSAFAPEYAWNYELGLKSRWLDDRLQLNLAAFHTEYTDMQVRQVTGTGTLLAGNAGSAKAEGIELESVLSPVAGLRLFATYGYLDATYQRFVLQGANYSGNRMLLSPEHSVSAGISYDWQLGSGGSLSLSSDYQYKSKVYFGPENDESSADDLSGVLNASLIYTRPDERWEVSVWGRNLGDSRDYVQASNLGFFYQPAAAFLGKTRSTVAGRLTPPLTWGVTFRWKL